MEGHARRPGQGRHVRQAPEPDRPGQQPQPTTPATRARPIRWDKFLRTLGFYGQEQLSFGDRLYLAFDRGSYVQVLSYPVNPTTGVPLLNAGNVIPSLGREGVVTAFYGNPRQIFLSLGYKF